MDREKAVFVIPGFRHQPTNKAYKEIVKILKSEGYTPIPVNVSWRKTTISENTDRFLRRYRKVNSRKKYILGFSFGAMIAFLASTKVEVCGLILCSLSPYFKEDLLKVNARRISSVTALRYHDFSQLRCARIAKQIKAKHVLMLYGSKEARSLKKRVVEAFDQISSTNKYLFPIKEAEHDIGNKRYLNKIRQITKELN